MSIIFFELKSKKEAVKNVRSSLWIIYIYTALMSLLFLTDHKNYIFFVIAVLYTLNAFFIKKFMCRAAAVFLTIISIPIGYLMYKVNIVNLPLNFIVFLSSVQMLFATFSFHTKNPPIILKDNKSKTWIFPSQILNALMLVYILLFFEDHSHLLYFKHTHEYSVLTILSLLAIFISIPFLLKKIFPHDKYGIKYYILMTITILIFVYSGLPKILHSKTKSEVTLRAKVLKIQKYEHTGKHGYSYNSCFIETSNEKLNHQEIDDIDEQAYSLLKESDTIIIHGELSNYLFKTTKIEFPDTERHIIYKRMSQTY